MPLLERVRVEVYLPDLPSSNYKNLLRSFEEEFTHAFGGSEALKATIFQKPVSAFRIESTCFIQMRQWHYPPTSIVSRHMYVELKNAASDALSEEAVLISVEQVYHAV